MRLLTLLVAWGKGKRHPGTDNNLTTRRELYKYIVPCVADTQFVKTMGGPAATQATEIAANVFETVVLDNSNRKYTLA